MSSSLIQEDQKPAGAGEEFKSGDAGLSEQAEFKGKFWVYGGLFTIPLLAPAVLIALFINDDDHPSSVDVWTMVIIPFLLWTLLQFVCLASLSNAFGTDIVEERNESVSIKSAMITTLSHLALVSALLLTTVIGMLLGKNGVTLLAKWYGCILMLCVSQTIIAVIVSVLGTLYLEPLSETAATSFIYENLIYFGEPMTMTIAGFLNFVLAVLLFVFDNYGVESGVMGAALFWVVLMRLAVTYQYLSSWKNPTLSAAQREERTLIFDAINNPKKSQTRKGGSTSIVPSP